MLYKNYWNLLLDNLDNLNDDEIAEYLAFINNQSRIAKFPTPMYIGTILPRVYIMQNAYLKLENMNFDNQEIKLVKVFHFS